MQAIAHATPPSAGASDASSCSVGGVATERAEHALGAAVGVAPNVAYFLPKNVDRRQVRALAEEAGTPLELERNFLNKHEKAVTAYFGFEEYDEEDEEEEAPADAVRETRHAAQEDPLFD